MSRRRRVLARWRPTAEEAGMGMVLVILVSTVVMAGGVLAVNMTASALGSSGQHVTYEQALHLAEEGIDQSLARLQQDDTWVTAPAVAALASTPTPADEEAWAMAQLALVPVSRAAGGEFAVVKPVDRNVVYAAGWVPSRAEPRWKRLLKAEYLFSTFRPTEAILVGGDLEISGSALIGGIGGNVHANGDLELAGSATVTGDLTASGSYTVAGQGASAQVDGDAGGSFPQRALPPVEPDRIWEQLSPSHADTWYDLCPDGTIRRPDAGAPCLGTVLHNPATDGRSYRGWSYQSGTSRWQKDGSGEYAGVYYVHQAVADLGSSPGSQANPWRATVIASGRPTGSGCDLDHGDVLVTGNPTMRGFVEGMALVAGRDLKVVGSAAQSFTGIMAAHEQVFVSGSPTLVGALVAEDACDTPGSPVSVSSISGSMMLTYDGGLDVALSSLIRTTLWLEL